MSMDSGLVPDDRHAGLLQPARQLQRRLAAELDDDALRALQVHDLHDVLEGQRLEVQAVRGVVVRGDGFRVAVDHDRFVADLLQREGGVHAAIVELDALADAVRPAAEDDDLLPAGRRRLALLLVGRVQIGRGGGELGGAGVHALEHRTDAGLQPGLAHDVFLDAEQRGQAAVGEALALEGAHGRRPAAAACPRHARGASHRIRSSICARNHWIDAGQLADLGAGQPVAEGVGHVQQPVGARHPQLAPQQVHVVGRGRRRAASRRAR